MTPLLHVPGQPDLRRRRRARRGGPGRPAAARRGRDRRRDLLARTAGDGARWSTRRVARGDVVVSVGGDGMLSSLAGAGLGRRAARSASCRPAAATTSPGCSGCPTTAEVAGRAAARRRRAPGRPDLARRCPAPAAAVVAGSVYAGVDARAGEIVDRAHWLPRKAAVPVRRAPRARDVPPGRYLRLGRRRSSASTPPPPSWSPTPPTTARA